MDPKFGFQLYNDQRIDSFGSLMMGLSGSIERIRKRLDNIEWYDGLWAKEDSEFLLGMVFLGSQNYIHNTRQDFMRMAKHYEVTQPSLKDENTDFIWNIANYFKHHESWNEFWSDEKDQRSQDTIKALKKRNITQADEFRCYKAYSLHFGEDDIGKFSKLKDSLVSWRSKLKQQLESCIEDSS